MSSSSHTSQGGGRGGNGRTLYALKPNTAYSVLVDGAVVARVTSDASGRASFEVRAGGQRVRTIEFRGS